MSCGISTSFEMLFPTLGKVAHVLLTRLPLYSPPEGDFRVRLACVKHAASVRSEPGSNSPYNLESCDRKPVLGFRNLKIGFTRSSSVLLFNFQRPSRPKQESNLKSDHLACQPIFFIPGRFPSVPHRVQVLVRTASQRRVAFLTQVVRAVKLFFKFFHLRKTLTTRSNFKSLPGRLSDRSKRREAVLTQVPRPVKE